MNFERKKKMVTKLQTNARTNQRGRVKFRANALCQKEFKCELCECSFVREDSLRSHVRHHQELMPTTGAALAILELQRDSHPNGQTPENRKQTEEVTEERTEPQVLELEVETSGKDPKSSKMIEVESQLYRRLMQGTVESSADHSYNRSVRQTVGQQSKRGRPQKKLSSVSETENSTQALRLVATRTDSGQVVYQLPQSMRLISYVPIDQNNGDTLFVINSEDIPSNSDTVIPTECQ